MEYQELLFIANGNINSTVTLKDDLVVSYKTKHAATRQPGLPW